MTHIFDVQGLSARPPELQASIDSCYDTLVQSHNQWGLFNAVEKEPYQMANIKEYELFKRIILENPERTVFYAVDIGAGEFGWCEGLADYLDRQIDLPDSTQVHIFGMRAENAASFIA
jgi:hypothetical protein